MIESLAQTFAVTPFDVIVVGGVVFATLIFYYYLPINKIFESAFGATLGIGVYILLSVLLVGNVPLGTNGGLFPFGFSVFIISLSVYLVFILAVLFPLHGGLIISKPTQPVLYTTLYLFVGIYLFFGIIATIIYMIEQSYIFRVNNVFTWFRDGVYYQEVVRNSWLYQFVMTHQNTIIPLGVILMLYKLLLSNLVTAAALSIWYNLSHVGFYKKNNDSHYRVEFHEVGAHEDAHASDDHGGHDAHAGGHGGHH